MCDESMRWRVIPQKKKILLFLPGWVFLGSVLFFLAYSLAQAPEAEGGVCYVGAVRCAQT